MENIVDNQINQDSTLASRGADNTVSISDPTSYPEVGVSDGDDVVMAIPDDLSPALQQEVQTIQTAMQKVDDDFSDTRKLRDSVIDKMYDTVQKMTIDFGGEKSSTIEMKLKAVDTLRGLLTDKEKAAVTHVSTKLRQKDSESTHNVAQLVAETLSRISMKDGLNRGTAIVDDNIVQDELEKRFVTCGCAVISESEIRDDPYDFSGPNGQGLFEKEKDS